MIPHRPPPFPIHLLDPAERLALQDFGDPDEWARACADAALDAIESPDARHIREQGLSSSALRPGRNLGERTIGDDRLGREVLTALAKRQRGER